MSFARPSGARRAVVVVAFSLLAGAAALSAAQRAPGTDRDAPTFARDVAPILYAKCASCHRPGEVAPMSLLTYDAVRPWARSIRAKVLAGEMPPWHADPAHGAFRNDRRLAPAEIDTLVAWADAGAPEGRAADLPPAPDFPDGWQIGVPDLVVEMPVEYDVPPAGTIEYQYFEVPTNFAEDRWMQAGEVRAGDREHVHHIIVYVIEPEGIARPNVVSVRPILRDGQPAAPRAARPVTPEQRAQAAARLAQASRRLGGNMLVNWAVGEDAPVHEAGTAKRIPAGSTLLFQVHYTTNGNPGRDRSKIGLIFADEPPRREIRTGMILNAQFAIPPGEANYRVESEAAFTEDVNVWSLHPHMHYRGKDMTYTAVYPDGRRDVVLRVPTYDFGWQTDYWLAEPLALPKGSTLHVSAHFDNSRGNAHNPDPEATVRWGDQTWEEMMIGFFTYTVEGGAPSASVSSAPAGAGWPAPRTPWGDPDLQGTWSSAGELGVPFERAAEFGERQFLTDEEFAAREARAQAQLDTDNADFDLETADRSNAGQVGSATSPPPHWLERGTPSRRTSIVIDPPDGRVPPVSAEALRRLASQPLGSFGGTALNGPEDFRMWDRCITLGVPGAFFPTVYNANTRIVQGPGYVAITSEMVHDTRIVRLGPAGGNAHVSPAIRQHVGDSRGHWEGDTLVVDVTNFPRGTNYRGSGEALHLVERFTRVDADTLRYEVTVEDPSTWGRPWTAALNLGAQTQGMFEYACHEGNHAMTNMLTAARAADE